MNYNKPSIHDIFLIKSILDNPGVMYRHLSIHRAENIMEILEIYKSRKIQI